MNKIAAAIIITPCIILLTACSEKENPQMDVTVSKVDAQTNLSEEAVKGPEVTFDPESAVIALQYYINEARLGSPYAQLSVGEAYIDGRTVPVNLIEAYAWLKAAQSQDITEAAALIDKIWEEMSEEDQKYAKALGDYYTLNYASTIQ